MKFKDNETVITLVEKGNVKKGSIGTIVCVLENPKGYDVEFCNDEDYEPWGYETYKVEELKLFTN